MAQIGRAIKRAFLQALPSSTANSLLSKYPNLRKAAPPGKSFVFNGYCSDIRVNIDTRFKVERIMWSGTYEPTLVRFLNTRDTRGWTCMDIGANVGAITLLLAKMVGEQGRIFAIEPGPPNLSRLRKNLELNPNFVLRTEVIAGGLGRERKELWWAEEEANPGNAMLAGEGSHRIPVDTLDNVVRDHDIDDIDFIKIDVEGMELEVMQGGRLTLQRMRPMLYFETLARYGDVHSGDNFKLIEGFLCGECGYELFRIDSSGSLHPVNRQQLDDYTIAMHPDRRM